MVVTDKHDQKIITFVTALQDCYRDEENRELNVVGKIEISSEEITDDFIAMLQSMHFMYAQFTGDEETDLIGFTHILNRLAFQLLMDNNAKPRVKDNNESED